MPIYEYGCEACGHTLEVQQKFSDAPLKTCPECGKDELRKLISATAFVLKGSGWYKDGYGSKKGEGRTENQRADRLQKALDEDKKKTATAAAGSDSGGSAPSSSSSSSSSGSGGSGGGGGGGGAATS